MLSRRAGALAEGPSVGEGLVDGQARPPARFREARRIHDGAAAQRRLADVNRDGGHVRIGVEAREVGDNIRRRVRDVEPADDLVERRLIGQESGRRNDDRPIGRNDGADLARILNQRRQAGLNIPSRIMDREQHRRPVRILQIADRRRIGRELRNRSADLAVVRNRDRRNVRIVELVEVRRQIGRRTGDVEPANDLIERRLIGQECGRRNDDRPIGRDDRGDLVRFRNQRRQPGLNIRGRIIDCEQRRGKVGVPQLADRLRRRFGRQLLN